MGNCDLDDPVTLLEIQPFFSHISMKDNQKRNNITKMQDLYKLQWRAH